MTPDLGQRLAAALDRVQALGTREAERYVRSLRTSDPEVAGRLAALLNLAPGEAGEATVLDEPTPSSVVPLVDPARRPELLGEPTASGDVRATASFQQLGPPLARDPGRPPPGGLLLNRYQLLYVVGRGAFGEVWKAFDTVLEKHFAVKISRPDRPLPIAAFLDEARKAASLPKHPAIVHMYDVTANGDGWYIISEFIDGECLRSRLATDRVSFDHAARIVKRIAEALYAAHVAGLVHRDVKPGNILLDRAGNAYLTDFGLAVREEEQSAERSKVSGTLAYMSPEQISGDTHLLDGRADIYALGAVFYELLTGRPLFRAADYEEYRELIVRREPRPPRTVDPDVPEELERICLKCLAKAVKDRYRTAKDLAADLEVWLTGSTQTYAPPGPPIPARNRWKQALGAGIALALVVGVIAIAIFGGNRSASTVPDRAVDQRPIGFPPQKPSTVQELLWFPRNGINTWEVLPETNQLKAFTDKLGLLQLGETSADTWTFTVTIRQPHKVGAIGLFLGYRRENGTAVYERICLQEIKDPGALTDRIELQRAVCNYSLDKPLVGFPETRVAMDSVQFNGNDQNTFRIVVGNNRLSAVCINGQPFGVLLNGTLRPPANGGFGVYIENTNGIFSDPLFNEKPIPLQVGTVP